VRVVRLAIGAVLFWRSDGVGFPWELDRAAGTLASCSNSLVALAYVEMGKLHGFQKVSSAIFIYFNSLVCDGLVSRP